MKRFTVILTVLTDNPNDTAKIIQDACPIVEDFNCQYGLAVTRIEIRDLDRPEDKSIWEHSPEFV